MGPPPGWLSGWPQRSQYRTPSSIGASLIRLAFAIGWPGDRLAYHGFSSPKQGQNGRDHDENP
jgi:hypothetical protein